MAYEKGLAKMISALLAGRQGFEEKKMFGGIGYKLHGNMACGILNDDLIVRVGPENHATGIQQAAPYPRV